MDSNQRARGESQDQQQPEEATVLNYIDKVHASVSKQWDALSRTLTAQTILSLITLAICIGAVTPREKFSLLGLGFSASITTVLIGSAFLITAFYVMAIGSFIRAAETNDALRRLYGILGNQDESMQSDSLADPFTPPIPLITLVSVSQTGNAESKPRFTRLFENTISNAIAYGIVLVLPIAAQIAALIRVGLLVGWGENLLWIVLVIPMVVSVACTFWLRQKLSGEERSYRPEVGE